MFNSQHQSNVRQPAGRSKHSYVYTQADKANRNENRSLQRNLALNQPLLSKNGYAHLNQSVEGDIMMLNSKFSPANNDRFVYANGEPKRTNSSVKVSVARACVVTSSKSSVRVGRS